MNVIDWSVGTIMHPVTSAAGRPTQRLEKDGWVFETKKLVMANAPELVRYILCLPFFRFS